jgi:hypothetical protein
MNVAVLGCGPAGLVVAHAARMLDHNVTIFSDKVRPSVLYGCQYLHQPVPGYQSVSCAKVSYSLFGTPAEYRRKVYGDEWAGKVSPEDFIGEHYAWDIRQTYHLMWEEYGKLVRQFEVINGHLPRLGAGAEFGGFNKIISTIPATAMCYQAEHSFRFHAIWANGSTKEFHDADISNEIICNGTGSVSWYRIADVFGYRTVEWPAHPDITPDTNAVRVMKPLSTNCTCNPDIVRLGRYGEWAKGRLVHEVYDKALEILK